VQGGIFGSLVGYDGLYSKDNLSYTRPWGADFTPYLMMGVNASYPFSDKLTAVLFAINGYCIWLMPTTFPALGARLPIRSLLR